MICTGLASVRCSCAACVTVHLFSFCDVQLFRSCYLQLFSLWFPQWCSLCYVQWCSLCYVQKETWSIPHHISCILFVLSSFILLGSETYGEAPITWGTEINPLIGIERKWEARPVRKKKMKKIKNVKVSKMVTTAARFDILTCWFWKWIQLKNH